MQLFLDLFKAPFIRIWFHEWRNIEMILFRRYCFNSDIKTREITKKTVKFKSKEELSSLYHCYINRKPWSIVSIQDYNSSSSKTTAHFYFQVPLRTFLKSFRNFYNAKNISLTKQSSMTKDLQSLSTMSGTTKIHGEVF